jgi:hypothetical protein
MVHRDRHRRISERRGSLPGLIPTGALAGSKDWVAGGAGDVVGDD